MNFYLIPCEQEYLHQLNELISKESEFSNIEKLLNKKYEFIKQLHIQEIEYEKMALEMRKVDDKYDLDRRYIAK